VARRRQLLLCPSAVNSGIIRFQPGLIDSGAPQPF
jgi:hypothetical protein